MIKKNFCLLLPAFLYTFCCHTLCAQPANPGPALTVDSSLNKHYLKPSALIVPGTLLLYGGMKPIIKGIQNLDNNIMTDIQQNHSGFHTNAADYIMWVPSASLYFMDALKVKTIHSFSEHIMIDVGTVIITGGFGYAMRLLTQNDKVYNERGTKFPSGHVANAFRGAEILHQELNNSNKLLSYSGYVIAASVGVLRIYDKDHLLSEVLAGAGLGIISTKLTYLIFEKIKYKRKPN